MGKCEEVLRILLSSLVNERLALDRFFKNKQTKYMILIIIYFSVTISKDITGAPQQIASENYQKQTQKKVTLSQWQSWSLIGSVLGSDHSREKGCDGRAWLERDYETILKYRSKEIKLFTLALFGSKWVSNSYPFMWAESDGNPAFSSVRSSPKLSPQWGLPPP